MLRIDDTCCVSKKTKVSDNKPALRGWSLSDDVTGRVCPQITIGVLPDNVLLEIFDFYLGEDDSDKIKHNYNYDGWHKLVHVCHRWRCIIFASPRRLDLKLYCTRQRPVNSEMLDILPALPIVVVAENMKSKEDVANITAALSQHNRVCKVYYRNGHFQDSLLKEFVAMDEPFPALISLKLISSAQNVPVLPISFLGGSAPRLRSLHLNGIPYPSVGKLLSSTTNLVRLFLWHIPHSGYISPKAIVPCLSMLPRLKSLRLGFQCPRSQAHRASRHSLPLARVIFPNLTSLVFSGDVEYLEDVLSQIETPILNQCDFWFFNQLVFDTPLLGQFIHRTDTSTTIHTARVHFFSWAVKVKLSGREDAANNGREALQLKISCKPLDWQLSAVTQVLNSFLPYFPTLEILQVAVSPEDWQGEIEVVQWREFLRPFTSVKEMSLEFEDSVRHIAPALQEVASENETEVLPALQNLALWTYPWRPSGPVKEAIEQFIATRQLCGCPITFQY